MSKPKINNAASHDLALDFSKARQSNIDEGYIEALDDVIATLRAWDDSDQPLHAEGLIGALEVIKGRKQQ